MAAHAYKSRTITATTITENGDVSSTTTKVAIDNSGNFVPTEHLNRIYAADGSIITFDTEEEYLNFMSNGGN